MKKFTYNVTQTVEVEIDESKFDQEYLDAFSEVMWQVDDISEVVEHIARNKALFDGYDCEFVPNDWYKAKVVDEFSQQLAIETFVELDELSAKVEQMLKDAKKKMKEKKDEQL